MYVHMYTIILLVLCMCVCIYVCTLAYKPKPIVVQYLYYIRSYIHIKIDRLTTEVFIMYIQKYMVHPLFVFKIFLLLLDLAKFSKQIPMHIAMY